LSSILLVHHELEQEVFTREGRLQSPIRLNCHAEYTYIAEMTHAVACQCQSALFSRAAAV